MEKCPYIAYYRVSTDKQGCPGLGLEAQQKAVASFLENHGGALLDDFTEVETGKGSQPLIKRPQLAAALDTCRKAKASLLIASLDRLARNVHFISGLMESSVPFVAVDMPNASPFEIHIRAAMAEEERRKISQRTKAALAAAKRRGVRLGRNGKVLAKRNKKAADSFAQTMRPVIDELRAEGITTMRGMVEALNARSVPTAKGGRWYLCGVHNLLRRID